MKVTLPVVAPQAFDNSMLETHGRCPRKAWLRYWLGRVPPTDAYALKWGSAYHKYREELENLYIEGGKDFDPQMDELAREAAFLLWDEEPSLESRRSWMTNERFTATLDLALERWMFEKSQGNRDVIHAEQAFQIELPSGEIFGGRVDQLVEWNGKLWVRDFKTTSRLGRTYGFQFDPNHQMSGYTYAMREMSGRRVQGVIIETIYNNKTKGPEIHEHVSTRSDGHLEKWLKSIETELKHVRMHEEQDFFPLRTVACNDYGGCMYREACQKEFWPTAESWLADNTIEDRWDFMEG